MTSSHKRHQHDYRLKDGYFHKKLEIHVSSSLSNKQMHSAFTQTKIFLSLVTSSRKRHQHNYRLMDGCFHKNFKFMSTVVFQIEEICVQGKRNFLVLRMQLNNKDRHDYRFNEGCFHEFVAIHFSNSFSSKKKKSAFKQIEFFVLMTSSRK